VRPAILSFGMSRTDISDSLIHFTGPGDDWNKAYQNLKSILSTLRIIAGTIMIKGQYPCVCFTEAPFPSLKQGLLNPDDYSRYSPFGVMFQKAWVFEKGGRPVVYQTDEEYAALPESLRWRHVRYEPNTSPPTDFTWEREWRIPCKELPFDPPEAKVIVPDSFWRSQLIREHERYQDDWAYRHSQVLDEDTLEQYREPFPWKVLALVA
jgi:hypothetical protein